MKSKYTHLLYSKLSRSLNTGKILNTHSMYFHFMAHIDTGVDVKLVSQVTGASESESDGFGFQFKGRRAGEV